MVKGAIIGLVIGCSLSFLYGTVQSFGEIGGFVGGFAIGYVCTMLGIVWGAQRAT